jgi:N-methylhydantoinase B/oxoprolinase/acetone carboxylase alpha subunit
MQKKIKTEKAEEKKIKQNQKIQEKKLKQIEKIQEKKRNIELTNLEAIEKNRIKTTYRATSESSQNSINTATTATTATTTTTTTTTLPAIVTVGIPVAELKER